MLITFKCLRINIIGIRHLSERMQAEMKLLLLLLHVFITSVYTTGLHRVPCGIGAASCSCSNIATSCEFHLQISSLQTFTRYPNNGTVIHDFDGSLHYIDENGRIVSYDGTQYTNGFTEAATVDGKTYRPFIAVNGRSPGPTLIVTETEPESHRQREEQHTRSGHNDPLARAVASGYSVDGRRTIHIPVPSDQRRSVPLYFQSPTVGNLLVSQPCRRTER